MTATASGFARPNKPRMRQQRNNSVAAPGATTAPPAEDDAQLSIVTDDATAGPDASETTPQGSSGAAPQTTGPESDTPAENSAPQTQKEAEPTTPETDETAPETDPPADSKPASKAADTKPAPDKRRPAEQQASASGVGLAVINPDGSVDVADGVHLVDLREVAAESDPHALVDMLGALRTVGDSPLREQATAAISEAITAAALGR
ncbi:hypothetical protein [Dietzia sp. 179-F 9C3 NHS]|uniref:hypothetical protein n=1 Tax=Dietzia sp. 179-F 9C3 NHS TaxID=3374295 RepID=UPI00387A0482